MYYQIQLGVLYFLLIPIYVFDFTLSLTITRDLRKNIFAYVPVHVAGVPHF